MQITIFMAPDLNNSKQNLKSYFKNIRDTRQDDISNRKQQQKQNELIQNFIEQQTANQTSLVVQNNTQDSTTKDKINKLNSYSPYEILGVSEFASISEIKSSYKKKVLKITEKNM